jgi:hypothetical protein
MRPPDWSGMLGLAVPGMSERRTINSGRPSGDASTSGNGTYQIQSTAPESCDTRNAVADSSSAAAIASADNVRACASLIRSSSIQLNISGDIDAYSLSKVRSSALPGQRPYPHPSHTVHLPRSETRQKCYAARPKVLPNPRSNGGTRSRRGVRKERRGVRKERQVAFLSGTRFAIPLTSGRQVRRERLAVAGSGVTRPSNLRTPVRFPSITTKITSTPAVPANTVAEGSVHVPRHPIPPVDKYRKSLARPRRFELLTPRSVVWCSIQLSYGRREEGGCSRTPARVQP